jgi:hypothetical protein
MICQRHNKAANLRVAGTVGNVLWAVDSTMRGPFFHE